LIYGLITSPFGLKEQGGNESYTGFVHPITIGFNVKIDIHFFVGRAPVFVGGWGILTPMCIRTAHTNAAI